MEDADKLKKHLSLLRDEYVKLQAKHGELERKYNVIVAAKGGDVEDCFVSKLLKTVGNLFDKEEYSDLTIFLDGSSVKAHKFVLLSRSEHWGVPNLRAVDSIFLSDVPQEIAINLLKWVYTDFIELGGYGEEDIMVMMKAAKRFHLASFVQNCEKQLMSYVNVHNCVKFYQIAEEIGATSLKDHCSELISTHWNDFTSDDFASMPAALLYEMFKTKSDYPLHTAVRVAREDVVFLYLMENDSKLAGKVNEVDRDGDIPLDIALKSKQEGVARTLINHKANVNIVDNKGKSLLHRAIERKDEFAANFLIDNNVSCDTMTALDKETPLHVISAQELDAGMTAIASKLLAKGADPNYQDNSGNTPLHRAVSSKNTDIFNVLVNSSRVSLDVRNGDGLTPLALALRCLADNDTFATVLVRKGASIEASNPITGDTLLHLAAKEGNETAGIFLSGNCTKVNTLNNRGETPLHLAAEAGLDNLVVSLLKQGKQARVDQLCHATLSRLLLCNLFVLLLSFS